VTVFTAVLPLVVDASTRALNMALAALLVAASVLVPVVAVTKLASRLHTGRRSEHDHPDRHGDPDRPRLPGVVPASTRPEQAAAGHRVPQAGRPRPDDHRRPRLPAARSARPAPLVDAGRVARYAARRRVR
jgi:hypothetical protein